MSEKQSAHSVTVKVTRIRTFAKVSACDIKKDLEKKMCRKEIQKPSDKNLRMYTLPCNKPLRINTLKEDTLLLSYKLYTKKQEIKIRERRAAMKLQALYKFISTDLKTRLYVKNPHNDIRTKTDIDENFFQYLNKHPASQYSPMYKSLRFQFHERLRTRHEIGYKKDYILNIEESYRKEREKYVQSIQKHAEQVKLFDEFVAKDYQSSMETLKKCDKFLAKLNTQRTLAENLASEQFMIQSRLICLDYLYFMQQKYGRFLYYLSPPSWRSKHREFAHSVEIEAMGFDLGSSSEEDTFNSIFQNMQEECSKGLVKPVLYFTHPSGLMSLYERMEKQYSNHFTHVVTLSKRAININERVKILKNSTQQDTASVAHLIEGFVQLVKFCDEREAQLKAKFMKILNGLFYETVAASDVLRLNLNLEFYYEKLYREECFNMSCFSIAKALENMYMEYSFKVEAFSNASIKKAMKKSVEKEANKIRKAHIAARELRSFELLERALLRAHEKRRPNVKPSVGPTATSFSKLPSICKQTRKSVKPMDRVSSQQYVLTEAELEYLRLFTNWTVNEDPAKYLHSLSLTYRSNSVDK